MDYLIHILIVINIYIILVLCANFLLGVNNLLSLCQGAFYGVGAYITAYALLGAGWSFFPALILAILATALVGVLLGMIALRLSSDYFILANIGLQIIIYDILFNWKAVTNGPEGISGIPAPRLFGLENMEGNYFYLLISSVMALATIMIFLRLFHSPFGRVLRGIRENEVLMQTLGRNTNALKIKALVIASGGTAVAGFLLATYISFIAPGSFDLDESIFILSAVIIGGVGNVKGSILGAVFVVVIPELLRSMGLPGEIAANFRMIVYGCTLCALIYFRPQGLLGNFKIT